MLWGSILQYFWPALSDYYYYLVWAPFRFISVIVWLLCWNSKLQYIIMTFSASSFRVTVEDWLSETDLSGPCSFFWMFLLLLKELIIIFLFVVTAAGVVPCGIPKKRPRTLSLVQFILYVWSFEISRNIQRNQKTL